MRDGMELGYNDNNDDDNHGNYVLRLTWQKHDAPELWDLQTAISSYPLTYQVQYSTNWITSVEQITVICDPFPSWHVCNIKCPPSLALRIYDKFIRNNWHHLQRQGKSLDDHPHPSLPYVIRRRFPTMQFVGDSAIVSTQFQQLDVDGLGLCHRTLFSGIKAQVIVDDLHGNLSQCGDDVRFIVRFDNNQLTLSQILNVCNLSSLLAHLPSLLVDRVRVRKCSLWFDLISNSLFVRGVTGNKKTDRFILFHTDKRVQPNGSTENNTILIKIHDSTIIDGHLIRKQKQMGSTGISCSYVYLDATHPLSPNEHFGPHMLGWKCYMPALCPLPTSCDVPVGSHFLFVKHFDTITWTPSAEFADVDDEQEPVGTPPSTPRSFYNIPLSLLCDSRCPSDLAQYVLDYVDIYDVIFGLHMLDMSSIIILCLLITNGGRDV